MSVTIKYKGLEDGPVLVTPKGRFPSTRPESDAPNLNSISGLYQDSRYSDLRVKVRQAEQERVLQKTRDLVESLAEHIQNLPYTEQDIILTAKMAISPKPAAISAELDQEASAPALHTVEVIHPAMGGQIKGAPQNPIAPIEVSDGEHTFQFVLNGEAKTLSITANNSRELADTQAEFLERMARAINMEDPSISARVEYSFEDAYDPHPGSKPMNRVARLIVESLEEGAGPDFYLTDSDGEDIISTYGLDKATPARAARVRVLGELRDQDSNTISLDNGHLLVQALDNTVGPVNLEVIKGPERTNRELQDIINEYNILVDYVTLNSEYLRPSLKDRITRPLEEMARYLIPVGIRGTLQGKAVLLGDFAEQLSYNYAEFRGKVIDDQGWLGALKTKLDQILGMEMDNFAAQPYFRSPLEENRLAQAMLLDLTEGIINGYY